MKRKIKTKIINELKARFPRVRISESNEIYGSYKGKCCYLGDAEDDGTYFILQKPEPRPWADRM